MSMQMSDLCIQFIPATVAVTTQYGSHLYKLGFLQFEQHNCRNPKGVRIVYVRETRRSEFVRVSASGREQCNHEKCVH